EAPRLHLDRARRTALLRTRGGRRGWERAERARARRSLVDEPAALVARRALDRDRRPPAGAGLGRPGGRRRPPRGGPLATLGARAISVRSRVVFRGRRSHLRAVRRRGRTVGSARATALPGRRGDNAASARGAGRRPRRRRARTDGGRRQGGSPEPPRVWPALRRARRATLADARVQRGRPARLLAGRRP